MRIPLTVLVAFALLLCMPWMAWAEEEAPVPPPAAPEPTGRGVIVPEGDVRAQVLAWNDPKGSKPPTEFRTGHVSPLVLPPETFRKTELGFEVALPSAAPVPTPTVVGGRAFVSGGFRSKSFHAFDAATGKALWGITLDDDGPSSAVVEKDHVIFNTESCTVFVVDAKTGAMKWSLWLGDPLMSTPAVADGLVYTAYPASGRAQGGAAPTSHVFCALDVETGAIRWQRWIDSDVMSAPVVVKDPKTGTVSVHATSLGGVYYTFHPKTGAIQAAKRLRGTSAPIVVQGEVFLARRGDAAGAAMAQEMLTRLTRSGDESRQEATLRVAPHLDGRIQRDAELAEQGVALDAANGFGAGAPPAANARAAFENIGQGGVYTCQAFQGSRVLRLGSWNFTTMGSELLCVHPDTGAPRWKVTFAGDAKKQGGALATSPAAAGGRLVVGTLDGSVLIVDPKTGKILQTYKAGGPIRSQPAVMDGRIHVGTMNGRYVMIDTGDRTLTGWSTWGGDSAHTGVMDVTPAVPAEAPAKDPAPDADDRPGK